MRNIADMQIIEIEVTNACDRCCSNCTRFCGHYLPDSIYFIDPEYFEKAVITLKNFDGIVGMIGGEPTLHPEFPELCRIITRHVPEKKRRGLLSNCGGKYRDYTEIIEQTFGYLNLNNHVDNNILHTPILVASEDLLKDGRLTEDEWRHLTDNCWVQMTWSATITPKGAYFCEVAGMLDYIFQGNIGWNIDEQPVWWQKPVGDYVDQMNWACKKCGCQLPLTPRRSCAGIDDISASNLKRLQSYGSPKIREGLYEIYNDGLDYSQIRNVSWYWNRAPESILKRFVKRALGYIQSGMSKVR